MDDAAIEARYAPTAHIALEAWKLGQARLELVGVSENVTFRAEANGERYVLRFHRPGYNTLDELVSERAWIRALSESGLRVPEAVPTPDGRDYVGVDVDGVQSQVGLTRWAEGVPLAHLLDETPERVGAWYETLGRLAATLHTQAVAWDPPPGFTRRAWDADGLMGERPMWGRFWDLPAWTDAEREILSAARAHIHERLVEYGTDRPTYSLIHADLHAGNVLIDGDAPHLIDFDDAGFGWHQHELAVALYLHETSPHFDRMRESLIRGYCQVRPLGADDLAMLPLFMLARGLMLIGWADARPELGPAYERFRDGCKTRALAHIEKLGLA
jgi:Ser/Thr protein kinase RdoA (MazF antagonist)